MKELISTEEIKHIELSILKYIDSVCKENGLKYFLAYGTLLGAVRHKGFIPWDDDIDIYMMRDDYDKFIKLLTDNEESHFRLLSMYNDSEYFYEFAKVVDSRTQIDTKNIKKIEHEGVWIDIFPLDDAPKYLRMAKWFLNCLVACRILSVNLRFPSNKYSRLLYPLWAVSKLIGPKFFLKLSDRIAKCGKSNEYVGYMCSMGISKYYFNKQWCSETIMVDFEGKQYPAFKQYDEYLNYQYGNYMQLPPEDKRISHQVEAYWRE